MDLYSRVRHVVLIEGMSRREAARCLALTIGRWIRCCGFPCRQDIGALIRARSQADVAAKMDVTQSRIAKMEGGINVFVDALKRYAEATGTTLNISLNPTG